MAGAPTPFTTRRMPTRLVRSVIPVAVVLVVTLGLSVVDSAPAAALDDVIPPIIGNTEQGTSSEPVAIQAFEAAEIQKVLSTHSLPGSAASVVQAWGRD